MSFAQCAPASHITTMSELVPFSHMVQPGHNMATQWFFSQDTSCSYPKPTFPMKSSKAIFKKTRCIRIRGGRTIFSWINLFLFFSICIFGLGFQKSNKWQSMTYLYTKWGRAIWGFIILEIRKTYNLDPEFWKNKNNLFKVFT